MLSDWCPNLQHLALSGCKVSNKSVKGLSKSGVSLRTLLLARTAVTASSHLSSLCSRLEKIDISYGSITKQQFLKLQKSAPGVDIVWA